MTRPQDLIHDWNATGGAFRPTQPILFDDETVRYGESRINLGKGRGRLRRIVMQVSDPRQGATTVAFAHPNGTRQRQA